MKQPTMIQGAFVLTAATLFSKIMGFIYVIPFTALVGMKGYIMFEYAYKPYMLMISLATLGIPMAVSKFVSKYNERGDYQTTQRLFRSGFGLMLITGFLSFAFLYGAADPISTWLIGGGGGSGNNKKDVIYVIRMVSAALLVVPAMAFVRGYFQGHGMMMPTAVSQVVEQLVRILFILCGSYAILQIAGGNTGAAVGISTFGACAGAVAGSAVLVYYWSKIAKKDMSVNTVGSECCVGYREMYKEIISYAIPFIMVGLAIPVYQTLDTFTINQVLMSSGYRLGEAELVNSLIALNQKVVLIPVSLATAFSIALVPAMTRAVEAGDRGQVVRNIGETLRIIVLLTIPSSAGLWVLSNPVYASMFGVEHMNQGGALLKWYAGTALCFSLFSVTAAMLQGLNQQKFAVSSLLWGLAVKIALNPLCIEWFQGSGTALSTYAGFSLSIWMNLYRIRKVSGYRIGRSAKETFKITTASLGMAAALFASLSVADDMAFLSGYWSYLFMTVAGVFFGGGVYMLLLECMGVVKISTIISKFMKK